MKRWLSDLWCRLWFVLTGDCKHGCEAATMTTLETTTAILVVEADCPVHDR